MLIIFAFPNSVIYNKFYLLDYDFDGTMEIYYVHKLFDLIVTVLRILKYYGMIFNCIITEPSNE